MSTLSTHVLDAALGVPAAGSRRRAHRPRRRGSSRWRRRTPTAGSGSTSTSAPGGYGLYFDTGPWFAAPGRDTFFPGVSLGFAVSGEEHYHVALLLSPYAYTTYKGS